jgi:hypothetical protein
VRGDEIAAPKSSPISDDGIVSVRTWRSGEQQAVSGPRTHCHATATPSVKTREQAGGDGNTTARKSGWSLQDRESIVDLDLRA